MNKRGSQFAAISAVLIAALMALSVFAMPVAANTGVLNGDGLTPPGAGEAPDAGDIAGANSDTEQVLVDNSSGATGNLTVNATGDVGIAVKIDISDLTNDELGVDLSNAEVVDSNGNLGFDTGSDGSVGLSNLDVENEEIQLVVNKDSSGAGSNVNVTYLGLAGIDTSSQTTASGLRYTYRIEGKNSGDFGSSFSTDAIDTTAPFNIATIEVENTETGETTTETNFAAALEEARLNDELDPSSGGSASEDTIAVRPNAGTYQVDELDFDTSNTVLEPLDGDVTLQNQNNGPTANVTATGIEVNDITFDQNQNAVPALNVSDGAGTQSELDLSGATFENGNGDPAEYIEVEDGAGSLTVDDSTFVEGTDGDTPTGIKLIDDDGSPGTLDNNLDLTVTNSEFDHLEHAINVSSSLGLSSTDINSNTFGNNNIVQVNATASTGSLALDSIFSDNTFEKYVVTENTNDAIVDGTSVGTNNGQHAIYGNLQAADGVGDIGNNTQDLTTTISAGSHTLDDKIIVNEDGTTITAAPETNPENVSISTGGTTAIQTNSSVDELTVSGLKFSGDSTAANISKYTHDELAITDNQFVGIGDGTTVINGSNTELNNTDITGNLFEATSDSNRYYALNISEIGQDSESSNVGASISDNEIYNTSGTAINVTNLADSNSDNNDVSLTVEDNDIRLTGGNGDGAIFLRSLDTSNDSPSVEILDNSITTPDDGVSADGISVSAGSATDVTIEGNAITHLDGDNGVALSITAYQGDDGGLTVADNDFDDNGIHIDFDEPDSTAVPDADTLDSNNNFATFAFETANKDDVFPDDIASNKFFGTVGGAINDASGGNFIQVRPGTYEESGLDTGNHNLVSTGSADETVFTTDAEDYIINLNNDDIIVDDFTFTSSTDSNDADVEINGNSTLANSTFTGPGTDSRTAISIKDSGDNDEVINAQISNYDTGIDVSSAGTGSNSEINIKDSTVGSNSLGVNVNANRPVLLIRNEITDNTLGVDVADTSSKHIIQFNDIVSNDQGVKFADASTAFSANANWWGEETGPTVTEDAEESADILVDDTNNLADDDDELRPWLTSSYTELPTDRMVVVTDPTNPPADSTDASGAQIIVAVLDDGLADDSNVDVSSTSFVVDGPDDLVNKSDNSVGSQKVALGSNATELSAANPLNVTGSGDSIVPLDDTPGDYDIQAVNTESAVDSGTSVQSFTGAVDDVEVTSDTSNIVADGDDEANITLQLVDSEDNAVPRSDVSVSFSIDNNANAGVERVGSDTNTDTDGQATLTVTATTANETFTVTGIDDANNNADNVQISTGEPTSPDFQLALVEGQDTITQNESYSATVNVTNDGDGAGTQDINYDLEDSTGISQLSATEEDVQLDAGASQEITFEVAASDTQSLSTGDDYAHVFESDDDTLTSDGVSVVEPPETRPATFEVSDLDPQDVTVTNGTEITVSANINNTGSESGTQTVEFAVGDNGETVLDSTELTLDAAENETVEFTNIDTGALGPGEYTHGVYTDDDSQTATLTVEEGDVPDWVGGSDISAAQYNAFDTGESGLTDAEVRAGIQTYVENSLDAGGEPVQVNGVTFTDSDVRNLITGYVESQLN